MEPNNSNKNLGIGISIAVVALVVFVTAFFGKNSSTQTASNTQPADVNNTSSSTTTGNTNTKTSPVVNTTTVANRDDENDSNSDEDSEGSTNPATPVSNPVPTPVPIVNTTKKTSAGLVYKDGTYTATGSYDSPGGYDQFSVTLTVKNDIVTAASIGNFQGGGTSQRYYNYFQSGYQQYVVGKNLSTLNVGKVSRSSLTPIGFNDAVAQIRSQAKA
ncbi:MAG: hypothetical protein WCO65_00720 [bacterium]